MGERRMTKWKVVSFTEPNRINSSGVWMLVRTFAEAEVMAKLLQINAKCRYMWDIDVEHGEHLDLPDYVDLVVGEDHPFIIREDHPSIKGHPFTK